MQTVAFADAQPGTGKTTCVLHIAETLARQGGHRVLVVDVARAPELTHAILGREVARGLTISETVVSILEGRGPAPSDLIRRTRIPGVELVAGCSLRPVPADPFSERRYQPGSEDALSEFLAGAYPGFDYCLLDCDSNMGFEARPAIAASDLVVVPFFVVAMAILPGIDRLHALVDRPRPGREAPRVAYLPTFMQPEPHFRDSLQATREEHRDVVFETSVPYSPSFHEAYRARRPVVESSAGDPARRSMEALAAELTRRIGSTDPARTARRRVVA